MKNLLTLVALCSLCSCSLLGENDPLAKASVPVSDGVAFGNAVAKAFPESDDNVDGGISGTLEWFSVVRRAVQYYNAEKK